MTKPGSRRREAETTCDDKREIETVAIPSQRCSRYNRDGSKCLAHTNRGDGWCGQCSGFTTPARKDGERASHAPESEYWTLTDVPPALSPEEAYEVRVTRHAIRLFTARHGGTDEQVEAQLRSLLEDMLLQVRPCRYQRGRGGEYKIHMERFFLTLTPGEYAVVSYATRHRERSYAQVRAGVKSRIRADV